jgi:hypothetical protein
MFDSTNHDGDEGFENIIDSDSENQSLHSDSPEDSGFAYFPDDPDPIVETKIELGPPSSSSSTVPWVIVALKIRSSVAYGFGAVGRGTAIRFAKTCFDRGHYLKGLGYLVLEEALWDILDIFTSD